MITTTFRGAEVPDESLVSSGRPRTPSEPEKENESHPEHYWYWRDHADKVLESVKGGTWVNDWVSGEGRFTYEEYEFTEEDGAWWARNEHERLPSQAAESTEDLVRWKRLYSLLVDPDRWPRVEWGDGELIDYYGRPVTKLVDGKLRVFKDYDTPEFQSHVAHAVTTDATSARIVRSLVHDETLAKAKAQKLEETFTSEPGEVIQANLAKIEARVQSSKKRLEHTKWRYQFKPQRVWNDDSAEYPLVSLPNADERLWLSKEEFRRMNRWVAKVTGIPSEPRGCKFIWRHTRWDYNPPKLKSPTSIGDDEGHTIPERYDHIIKNTIKSDDPVSRGDTHDLIDTKAAAGEYFEGGDDPRFTIEKRRERDDAVVRVNTRNKNFIRDSFLVELVLSNPTTDSDDNGKFLEQAAQVQEIKVISVHKQVDRFRDEIREVKRMKKSATDGKAIPFVPLTWDQAQDIVENNAAYYLAKLSNNSEWKWHRLPNINDWGSEAEALEALKAAKRWEATRKSEVTDERWQAVQERIDRAFAPENTRVIRPPKRWKGVLGALTEKE